MDKNALIELVRKERSLWDHRDKGYHNRELKPVLWENIGEALNVSGKQAQKYWENLRDIYRRKLKESKGYKEEEEIWRNKWKFFKSLDFLRGVITSKHSLGKQPSENGDTSSLLQNHEESRAEIEASVEEGSSRQNQSNGTQSEQEQENTRVNNENKTLQSKKRKQPEDDPLLLEENRRLQILEKRVDQKSKLTNDDDYLFLMSLLPFIKKLNDVQKLHVRMEFLNAVTKKLEENKDNECVMTTFKSELSTSFESVSSVVLTETTDTL